MADAMSVTLSAAIATVDIELCSTTKDIPVRELPKRLTRAEQTKQRIPTEPVTVMQLTFCPEPQFHAPEYRALSRQPC